MQNLIPTHNTIVYATTSLISLILGSFFVCSHVYEKWLKDFNCSLMDINALIKGLIVLLGCSVIPLLSLFNGNAFIELSCLFCGFIFGYLLYKFEIFVIKTMPYQKRIVSFEPKFPKDKNNNIRQLLKSTSKTTSLINKHYSYFSTIIVGIFEELLYRGFLTIICLSLFGSNLSILGFVLVNCLFALSHINLGYTHIITKFVLGLVCLILFLLFESIFISMIIHATFNLLAVKKIRELQHV